MTLIVLGWDGLDIDHLNEYGIQLGRVQKRIGTIVNPVLDKPHTWELWPTIITGVHPNDHGIRADEMITNGFNSNSLNVLSRTSRYLIPSGLRTSAGRFVRNHGATFDFKHHAYYQAHDIPTLFDSNDAVSVAVPNARSNLDIELDIEPDRGAYLRDYVTQSGDSYEAKQSIHTISRRVEADLAKKIGITRSLYRQGEHDLIFVWLAYADTLGHIAPSTTNPRQLMKDTYQTIYSYTNFIERTIGPNDAIVCVSDHGLQDGYHTESATITGPEWIQNIDSVLDVKPVIDEHLSTYRTTTAGEQVSRSDTNEVRENLESLGYI